jgi:hypothetical protein
MRLLRPILLTLTLLLPTTSAMATGGFGCEIDDVSLSFVGGGTTGRGMGLPIINYSAEATVKLKDSPIGMEKIDLGSSLVHHWMAGEDLSLHFYWERGDSADASLELIIKTKASDDSITYDGGYRLIVSGAGREPEEVSGKAVCSAG